MRHELPRDGEDRLDSLFLVHRMNSVPPRSRQGEELGHDKEAKRGEHAACLDIDCYFFFFLS